MAFVALVETGNQTERIDEAWKEIRLLDIRIMAYRQKINRLENIIFGNATGVSLPEESLLHYFDNHIKAIEEYLKIKVRSHIEEDPNEKIEQPKIKVWRAEKIIKPKK